MYDYAIEFFRADGTTVCRVPIRPDWQPALEYARFADVRQNLVPAENAVATGVIEPRWHPQTGEPYLDGVSAIAKGPAAIPRHVPRSYFGGHVRTLSTALVKEGAVERIDELRFLVRAEPRAVDTAPAERGAADEPAATDFTIEEITQPLPITNARRDAFLDASLDASGDDSQETQNRAASDRTAGDIEVFLHPDVVAEGQARARAAGDVETGGILLGKLHRDHDGGDIFLEVTAQIPAEHTVPHETKLTFTPETWTAARTAVAHRNNGEVWCGWWHSHPDFCRSCPPERREHCTMASAFLSTEDLHLHRTCFPQAYTMALLFSATPAGLTTSLFGWRRGTVVERNYHLTDAAARTGRRPSPRKKQQKETCHAPTT